MTERARILVGEDDAVVARDIAETIRDLGYETTAIVGSGDEAVAKAVESRPDLVLLDIRMPGERDGVDAGREIMSTQGIPVVFVTAYGDDTTLRRAVKEGPFGYVLKPFQARELRAAIEVGLSRSRLEREVREVRERLDATLRSVGDGVVSTDEAGRVELMNPVAQRLTGHSEDDAVGKPVDQILRFRPEDGAGELPNPALQALARRATVRLEEGSLLVDRNGSEVPVSDAASPVITPEGQLLGSVLVFKDDTVLREKERQLRRNERRFRELAEQIEDVFWISSPDKARMIYISPAYETVFGRSRDELYERPESWLDAVVEEDRPRVREAARRQAREEYEEEYRIERPGGEVRWIWDRAFPVTDEEGRVVRIVGVAEDITERKQSERQLAQGQRMETVGRLAGGIAHDFNNLLTVIRAQADLLLLDAEPSSSTADGIRLIQETTERAAGLVSHLLAFSRDQVLRPQALDLSAVVRDTARLFGRTIPEDVVVRVDLDPDLPAVEIDEKHLEQLVMNLVVNARDAMPQGGTVELSTYVEELSPEDVRPYPGLTAGRWVTLRVEDTGVGMDEATLERVFEPFFSTKDAIGGSGLGLAMVYGFVKQSGGAVHAESEPTRGTTFLVRLPPAEGPERSD